MWATRLPVSATRLPGRITFHLPVEVDGPVEQVENGEAERESNAGKSVHQDGLLAGLLHLGGHGSRQVGTRAVFRAHLQRWGVLVGAVGGGDGGGGGDEAGVDWRVSGAAVLRLLQGDFASVLASELKGP